MYTYVLHDTRLTGQPRIRQGMVFTVNPKQSLPATFDRMRRLASAGSGQIDELQIMCHGMSGGVHDSRAQLSTSALGFGLQLGRENLTLSNVNSAGAIADLFPVIIVYACGPANTRAGFSMTRADGRRFCQELAAVTNTEIIAASETQIYHHGPSFPIDFGSWEGQVYRFAPDGTVMPHAAPPHSRPGP